MSGIKRSRSLRGIVFTFIGVCLATFLVLFYNIFRTTMTDMLLQSEAHYVDEQRAIVNGILAATVSDLKAMAKDVAIWDESVRFAQGENPGFIDVNWPEESSSMLKNYSFNFVAIKDIDGRDIYTDYYDFFTDEVLAPIPGFSDALIPVTQEVIAEARTSGAGAALHPDLGTHGVFFYNDLPYYVCTMPIMTYDDDSEPAGTVTFGIVMDDRFFKQVTHLTSTYFEIVNEPCDLEGIGACNTKRYLNDEHLLVVISVGDIQGRNIQLHMDIARTTYARGQAIITSTIYLLVLVLTVFVLLLYVISVRFIFRPLESLSADIEDIDERDTLDISRYGGNREFASLSGAINNMLARLDESNISISVFQSILNGMDACVYVSDPKTNVILFMNDKMIDEFGFKAPVVGQLCYELIQPGQTGRCDFCPNNTLDNSPTATVVWEEQSPITGSYYRNTGSLIEWSDNRLVHLQHRVNITDIRLAENSLKKRLDQQELMSAVSRSFISNADMQLLINNALRMSGEFLGVSRVLLSTYDAGEAIMEIQYAWYNEEQHIRPIKDMFLPCGEGHIFHREIIVGGTSHLICDHVKDVPAFSYLWQDDVESFVSVPVYCGDTLWGSLYFDHCLERYSWSESDLQLIKLIANVIAGVVQRNETEKDLLRMSSIAESSPQFIAYVNDLGDFEYLNQGATEKTGYRYEELMAGGMSLLFDEKTNRTFTGTVLPVIYSEGKLSFELPLIRKDGTQRIFSFSSFMTRASSGIGIIASDITEKNELEQALITARDQAEESSRAKGDFLSRMSHEMRTPMNAIIGMTNIAKSSDDVDKKSYCLDKIDEASSHLLGVINDILDMSKIESGKFELAYSAFDPEKMLKKVTDVMSFKVDEKDQNLIIHIDPALPVEIFSDEQRLSQVITNLLSNAVKFTPEQGTITVKATALAERDDHVSIQIDVSDTGIGITPEQQSRLFRSFEQADGGISRRFGGTGLGLAISKNIVELLGGRIWVQSEPGQGSTFSFVIEAEKRAPSPLATGLFSPGVNVKDLRILAVDDAPEVRSYFGFLAASLGISCQVAANAQETYDLLDTQGAEAFDILFIDWRMPDTNGIELIRGIEQRHGTSHVVIMLSATEWNDIAKEAREAGVDKFLPKPLYSSLIISCINECLGGGQSSREESAALCDYTGYFEGYRLLLAEDMEINREIVIGLLEHTGIAIDIAADGREACEKFSASPGAYDMIFMDIHMPEVDGYEATRTIRALDIPGADTIPIVAMTANVFREDIERCLAAGMNDHVGKPIDFDEIVIKLQKYLPEK